ncbi:MULTISPECIES: translation initiation factor 2 (IF-2, GTPase) [Pseudomonadaceae]|jgi:hypothetical protein|uniref:translation initiation factor 2 (IF-2, GTPase) n=1 Tax=Pseudomonadaceae TaxID=135621 RepID=UPI000BC35484|nr:MULTISPECIES: translation initiation factor 2 (IF-2, GTPase) [Pseudomonas]ATH82720.1 translation initiation factor 2 (IF-2, GTPase) [Pseudomonas mendocina]MBA4245235.1 translation initiation factor 2 (IF-2, GTPase) [Pseudomonas sp.]MBF8161369.1 translation initiation factor 2 (IF-2, GTPase) [Pseudomonas mendocina]MDH0098738.1 translation initiation factor 2 (IF-2, GTPase) [Pseudomonas sp. GD04158]UTH29901.1 translation initiation factor 2 (IF-2, GTPase) [Pseudomonas hydrolytica]
MRSITLSLLATLLLTCALAQAEEETTPPAAAPSTEAQALQERLAQSEQLRNEEAAGNAAQLQRLRQENQRLRLQLKESQAQTQPALLSEEQTWFALGAGLSLISVLLGALLRGSRKTRREWIN